MSSRIGPGHGAGLRVLGLNPGDLRAVRIEHTAVLPGIGTGLAGG